MKHVLERKSKSGNPYRVKIKFATGDLSLDQDEMIAFAHYLAENDMLSLAQILTMGYCLQSGNECMWFEFDVYGNCYSCNKNYGEEGIFADWRNERIADIYNKRKRLFENTIVHPECSACEYEFICNSGCPADRHKSGESAGKAHDCELVKIAYKELEKKGVHISDFLNGNI